MTSSRSKIVYGRPHCFTKDELTTSNQSTNEINAIGLDDSDSIHDSPNSTFSDSPSVEVLYDYPIFILKLYDLPIDQRRSVKHTSETFQQVIIIKLNEIISTTLLYTVCNSAGFLTP